MSIDGQQELIVSDKILANVFWLGKHNLSKNIKYFIKIGTEKVGAKLIDVKSVMDSSNLIIKKQESIACNEVAECIFQLDKEIAFDTIDVIAETRNIQKTIGTTNAAEFFVTIAEVATFFTLLNNFQDYYDVILGLIIGGIIAAPIGAVLCKKLPTRLLLGIVGTLTIVLNSIKLLQHIF